MSDPFMEHGGPAFPIQVKEPSEFGPTMLTYAGLTLRDYFAAHALAGMLANADTQRAIVKLFLHGDRTEAQAEVAYCFADAMLKAREAK